MLTVVPLICPVCRVVLEPCGDSFACSRCSSGVYPVKDGVVCFLREKDAFYEGAYTATTNITFADDRRSLKSWLFFNVYRDPYFRALRKHVCPNCVILDVGCGGGIRYLARKGRVVGIDLSHESLKRVTGFYSMAVQANALDMPFPDESFDIITSAYNFEHFPTDLKDRLLNQMNRVLKPGGKLISIFDCDNDNPLFRFLKKNSELYTKQIVENDGHYGLEYASVNIERFRKAGLHIIEYAGLNKSIFQYLPVYGWIKPYSKYLWIIRTATMAATVVSKNKMTWIPYNAYINWLDFLMESFLAIDHARLLIVVCRKEEK